MTNMTLARRAVRLYNNALVPKATNRANQRAWLRSVHLLGDRWLLANNQTLVRINHALSPDTLNTWRNK